MNKIFKYSIGVLFAGLAMTACSPDEFSGADPNGLPTISGVDFQLNVDQETNQMESTPFGFSMAPSILHCPKLVTTILRLVPTVLN
jgi:hypothetical protein